MKSGPGRALIRKYGAASSISSAIFKKNIRPRNHTKGALKIKEMISAIGWSTIASR
jgi:hypothetical protein